MTSILRRSLLVFFSIVCIAWFSPYVHGADTTTNNVLNKVQAIDSGTPPAASDSNADARRYAARRVRNTATGVAILLVCLWFGFRLRRHNVRMRINRMISSTLANLMTFNQSAPHHPQKALIIALLCVAMALFLFYRAWDEALRLGVRSIYLWEFAFAGAGMLATSSLFAICALLHRDNPTMGATNTRNESAARSRLSPVMLSFGCVMVLAAFRWFDLWNSAFDQQSWRYAVYNILRIAFMIYLVVALIGSGRWVLACIERNWGTLGLGPVEGALAAFFAGAAAWYIGLFPLGLLGFLRPIIIVPLFLSAVWFAWPLLSGAFVGIRNGFLSGLAATTVARLVLIGLPLGVLVPVWIQVLITQGLAVSGFGYDSSGHYLPYYQAVVSGGSTEVNELWYHFWISKGAGLHFVATMLTDIQGSQLVSFSFLTVAVMVIVIMVRRISGSISLGIAAAAIFLAPFTYAFAYYQKLHIVTTGLVGGILWIMTLAWLRGDLNKTSNVVLLTLLGLAAVLHTPPLSALICPFLAVAMLTERVLTKRLVSPPNWIPVMPAIAALLGIFSVLLVNYAKTGLMEVTPFRLFWNLADQTIFSNDVSPYLMLLAEEGTSPATGKAALADVFDPLRLSHLLHMQFLPESLLILSLLILGGCLVACFFDRKLRNLTAGAILPAMTLVGIAATLGILVRQPGSIDRFYVFVLLPLACLAVSAPGVLIRRLNDLQISGLIGHTRTLMVIVLIGIVVGFSGYSASNWITAYFHSTTFPAFVSKLQFVLGNVSFQEALLEKRQPPDAGAWPKGELSETCLGIRSGVQPSGGLGGRVDSWPKVWTMTFLQESGCHILPGVKIMMEYSNRFGEKWHQVVFGDAAAAETELDRVGIRHVFVDLGIRDDEKKTGESTSIFGCLAYSPLLDSATLDSKFRVVWRKDDAYLLVLASKGNGSPLPKSFAEQFDLKRKTIQPGLGDMRAMCRRLAGYYQTFGERWPARIDPSLPKLQGWQ